MFFPVIPGGRVSSQNAWAGFRPSPACVVMMLRGYISPHRWRTPALVCPSVSDSHTSLLYFHKCTYLNFSFFRPRQGDRSFLVPHSSSSSVYLIEIRDFIADSSTNSSSSDPSAGQPGSPPASHQTRHTSASGVSLNLFDFLLLHISQKMNN